MGLRRCHAATLVYRRGVRVSTVGDAGTAIAASLFSSPLVALLAKPPLDVGQLLQVVARHRRSELLRPSYQGTQLRVVRVLS
jgi:hypothetical protein